VRQAELDYDSDLRHGGGLEAGPFLGPTFDPTGPFPRLLRLLLPQHPGLSPGPAATPMARTPRTSQGLLSRSGRPRSRRVVWQHSDRPKHAARAWRRAFASAQEEASGSDRGPRDARDGRAREAGRTSSESPFHRRSGRRRSPRLRFSCGTAAKSQRRRRSVLLCRRSGSERLTAASGAGRSKAAASLAGQEIELVAGRECRCPTRHDETRQLALGQRSISRLPRFWASAGSAARERMDRRLMLRATIRRVA